MKLSQFCTQILESPHLEDKLSFITINDFDQCDYSIPPFPARSKKIQVSHKQLKFPKKFDTNEKKAIALNSFANHELLAIEMMACALLILRCESEDHLRLKKGILNSLYDEQKHFSMYRNRMNELGYEFGDFPLNDFFWKYMSQMTSFESYFAVMALTFEAANLDFASFYEKKFRSIGDKATADILKKVYEDEVSHVALGHSAYRKISHNVSLWDFYLKHLPAPLTPARAKGMRFNKEARLKAKLPSDFIQSVQIYRDQFNITDRKQWKEKS